MRPKKLAGDNVPIRDVIVDFIKRNNLNHSKFNFFLYPVAPLIKYKDLIKAYKKIKDLNYDLLISTKNLKRVPKEHLL